MSRDEPEFGFILLSPGKPLPSRPAARSRGWRTALTGFRVASRYQVRGADTASIPSHQGIEAMLSTAPPV